MDDQKQEEVKTYTQEELDAILQSRGKPAGRKKKPESEKKTRKKTMKEDGSYETHTLTQARKAALERARTKLYEKRQAKKQEALKHETKVSEIKTEPTATAHHTALTTHLQYQAPSHQPVETSTRPEPMYF